MRQGGRPLRFLLVVMGSWIGLRTAMLWPVAPVAAAPSMAPAAIDATRRAVVPRHVSPGILPRVALLRPGGTLAGAVRDQPIAALPVAIPALSFEVRDVAMAGRATIIPGIPHADPPVPEKARSRLFGSAWAVVRGGSGPAGGVPGVQLGGSQAGIRLAYALTGNRRLALAARATSPLGDGMRELAFGVEWQPTRLPLRIVAEQRFAPGAGQGGPTLAAVGGLGPVRIVAGLTLAAYAQGGMIGRAGGEGFADGAVRIARPIGTLGDVRVDLGAGGWAAVQRGARRLDVGPSLSAVLPIGPQPVRLSIDWRRRIGGNAAPGSGLAVTLGTDF